MAKINILKKIVFLGLATFGVAITLFHLVAIQSVSALSSVVISQIQSASKARSSDDFIELYNPSASPFNLKGYRLVKRSAHSTKDTNIKSWSKDVFIPPHSFYLWANAEYKNSGKTPDALSSATISDDNGIALRYGSLNTGLLVQSASWGASDNGFVKLTEKNIAPGQVLVYSIADSRYSIGISSPHNTKDADFSVAFEKHQQVQTASLPTGDPQTEMRSLRKPTISRKIIPKSENIEPEVRGTSTVADRSSDLLATAAAADSFSIPLSPSGKSPPRSFGVGFLVLAIVSLVICLFFLKLLFFKKKVQ